MSKLFSQTQDHVVKSIKLSDIFHKDKKIEKNFEWKLAEDVESLELDGLDFNIDVE